MGSATLLFFSFTVPRAKAGGVVSATATTLSVAPATSVTQGTVLTLQATVDAGGTPVGSGSATLYDGTHALPTVQVVYSGTTYPVGTASYKLYLGPGSPLRRCNALSW